MLAAVCVSCFGLFVKRTAILNVLQGTDIDSRLRISAKANLASAFLCLGTRHSAALEINAAGRDAGRINMSAACREHVDGMSIRPFADSGDDTRSGHPSDSRQRCRIENDKVSGLYA